ncbi:MAG: DUF2310 family Zn-ribbon-containing protein [Luteolibacter sp.]
MADIIFGKSKNGDSDTMEDIADRYLFHVYRHGQTASPSILAWAKGRLHAHVILTRKDALEPKYHSSYGKEALVKLMEIFGKKPVVKLQDDHTRVSSPWKGAPFLYLSTEIGDFCSPVGRGDGRLPVPLFTLPLPHDTIDKIVLWRQVYLRLDGLWMASGALEIASYREIATPDSFNSKQGRDLCQQIEEVTGIPTFYYLMRHCGRKEGEEERVCPGCGKAWKASEPESGEKFHAFHFKCDPCRLVSHVGKSADGIRLARIGEFHG